MSALQGEDREKLRQIARYHKERSERKTDWHAAAAAELDRLAEHGCSGEGEPSVAGLLDLIRDHRLSMRGDGNEGDLALYAYADELRAALSTQPGSGEGEECWAVGQILRHPNGSEWELVDHLVWKEHDDWQARCVGHQAPTAPGSWPRGAQRVFHREYMDRTFTVVSHPHYGTEEKPKCETCGGSKKVWRHPTSGFDKVPCPDCGEKSVESEEER